MKTLNIDFATGFEDAWSKIATFVPKLVACLAILFIGWIVARVISRIVGRVLRKLRADEVVYKAGLGKALGKTTPSDLAARVAKIVLMLITFQTAFGVFGTNPVSDALDGLVNMIPRIVVAGVILVITGLVVRFVGELLADLGARQSWGNMARRGAVAALWAVGGFAALNQLQVAPAIVNGLFYATLAVIVGSAIIAIGGGGIFPMRARWERALSKVEQNNTTTTTADRVNAS